MAYAIVAGGLWRTPYRVSSREARVEGTQTEGAAFVPTADDLAGIDAWFARYDALATAGDVEAMADMALFPLNLATDDAQGNGSAWQWTREQFVSGMGAAMGPEGPEGARPA